MRHFLATTLAGVLSDLGSQYASIRRAPQPGMAVGLGIPSRPARPSGQQSPALPALRSLVIERRFGISYTLRGVSYLLHRIGYSQQVPTRRAIERDPEAITGWHRGRWPSVRG